MLQDAESQMPWGDLLTDMTNHANHLNDPSYLPEDARQMEIEETNLFPVWPETRQKQKQ